MMSNYSFRTKVNLVLATMSIHNFIRTNSHRDEDFMEVDNGRLINTDDDSQDEMFSSDEATTSSNNMLVVRDIIRELIVRDLQNKQ